MWTGEPGEQLDPDDDDEEDPRLSTLVIVDNESDVPVLRVHMKVLVQVIVRRIAAMLDEPIVLSLRGNETLGQVKQLVLAQLPDGMDCNLYADATGLIKDDSMLVFDLCLHENDDFDPLHECLELLATHDWVEELSLSQWLDWFISACVCINAVFMCLEHEGASDEFNSMIAMAEWVFNSIFLAEMIFMITTMKGFCNYWAITRNRFDAFIVVSSWISVSLSDSKLGVLKILRVFRALRLLRALRKVESIKEIISATMDSIGPILDVLVFMMFVLTIYGCLGMQLYGGHFDSLGDDGPPRGNFDNFVMAFLTLFQVSCHKLEAPCHKILLARC